MTNMLPSRDRWLPPDKRAAVVLSVDDVHPAATNPSDESRRRGRRRTGRRDGGAPLHGSGIDRTIAALDHVRWLQARHAKLKVTLFTTPDWRSMAPHPARPILRRIPILRDRLFMVPVLARGSRRLDRYPELCAYLRDWERAEVALHGLHHVRRGLQPITEFAGQSEARCRSILSEALQIFDEANLPIAAGMCPPGWFASEELLRAMTSLGLQFIASARDLETPIDIDARTQGSGLRGLSLLFPEAFCEGRLIHFATNYQATSQAERAFAILDAGGLLCIKAHLLDRVGDYVALDGLTVGYREQLDELFTTIEARYGQSLWWTSMGEIARRLHAMREVRA